MRFGSLYIACSGAGEGLLGACLPRAGMTKRRQRSGAAASCSGGDLAVTLRGSDGRAGVGVRLCRGRPGEVCPVTSDVMGEGDVPYAAHGARAVAARPELVCAELAACGHRFDAVAFLVHCVRNGMRCPLCRAGKSVRLSAAQSPPLDAEAWLAEVARAVGALMVDEAAEEERSDLATALSLAAAVSPSTVGLEERHMSALEEVGVRARFTLLGAEAGRRGVPSSGGGFFASLPAPQLVSSGGFFAGSVSAPREAERELVVMDMGLRLRRSVEDLSGGGPGVVFELGRDGRRELSRAIRQLSAVAFDVDVNAALERRDVRVAHVQNLRLDGAARTSMVYMEDLMSCVEMTMGADHEVLGLQYVPSRETLVSIFQDLVPVSDLVRIMLAVRASLAPPGLPEQAW